MAHFSAQVALYICNIQGTENANLDEGHVIAESLGGMANAYSAHTGYPIRKLSYWKKVKKAYTKMIHEDVLPLRKR